VNRKRLAERLPYSQLEEKKKRSIRANGKKIKKRKYKVNENRLWTDFAKVEGD
jgi:hypothetical protein